MRIIQILPFCTCKNALFIKLTRGNVVSFNSSGDKFYLGIIKMILINVSREVNWCVYGFNQLFVFISCARQYSDTCAEFIKVSSVTGQTRHV